MRNRLVPAATASLAVLTLGLAPRPIVLYLAGDSTMAQKLAERRPETGWGEKLPQYFDLDEVRVENYARDGRSTRTFLSEGRWQAIVDRLEPSDVVFLQFGHNDESVVKRCGRPPRLRASAVDVQSSGLSPATIFSRCGSRKGGSTTFSPSVAASSSTAKPGPSVAISNRIPFGSRK